MSEGEQSLSETRKQSMITAFRSCGDSLNLASVKAYFAKLGVSLSNVVRSLDLANSLGHPVRLTFPLPGCEGLV